MNAPARPHVATDRIDEYLADLAARLRGPRRRREEILDELRDGLDRATDHYTAAGLTGEQAAAAAVAEFGDAQAVADAFSGELATAYARRTIAWYVATGPLVGVWWLLLLQPHPWRTSFVELVATVPVLPLVVIVIAMATVIFATTGRFMRWLPEAGPRCVLAATAGVAALCITADFAMILFVGIFGPPIGPLTFAAATASFLRVACGVDVIRRLSLASQVRRR